MFLSDVACRATKPGAKPKKLSDGGGLQLWVMPNGNRLWRLIYRNLGKQRTLCIGSYPAVSLVDARSRREVARLLLREGKDPITERERTRRMEQQKLNSADSFGKVAAEFMEKCRRDGLSEATLIKKNWMLGLALPKLKDIPICELEPLQVLEVLQDVEKRGLFETATTLRAVIGSVCRHAIFTARAKSDPTVVLRGAITTPKVKSYAAIIEPERFGELLRTIDKANCSPQTTAALQLLALLFPRPGELRKSRWPEFDFQKCVWTVPATRMKGRVEHRVPLPKQAIAILEGLKPYTGHVPFVFPSVREKIVQPLCENALNVALRRMGYAKDQMTSHGFRSSASTMLNESELWNSDAIERQLAHVEVNPVRRVYARNTHWKTRVEMMQWWADYLDGLRGGEG
jgi:integrase